MTYRAMILATSETDAPFKLIITLVEAPGRDVSKRSIVEGATMSYADAEDFKLILDSKGDDNDLGGLEQAIQSASQNRGIFRFAGFFDLSPEDLSKLGFVTMSQMAKFAKK
jgi:hypothetical protein